MFKYFVFILALSVLMMGCAKSRSEKLKEMLDKPIQMGGDTRKYQERYKSGLQSASQRAEVLEWERKNTLGELVDSYKSSSGYSSEIYYNEDRDIYTTITIYSDGTRTVSTHSGNR